MDTSTIILDQIAIWGPKANDAVSIKEVAVGTPYKTKGSQIISRAENGMIRVAKNYFVGGEPAEQPTLITKTAEQPKEVVIETEKENDVENSTEEIAENERTEILDDSAEEIIDADAVGVTIEDEKSELKELEEKATFVVEEQNPETQVIRPRFCLFVRSSRSTTEIERKLDLVATKITEAQALAAIGRINTVGPMSFEYTNFNLEEIE